MKIKITLLLIFAYSIIFAQNPFTTSSILPGADANMSQSVVFGDYNNDGWTDLYITKGSDLGNSYQNLLYKNSSGTFIKQTINGITDIQEVSGSATWGDYNNDGVLDIYVANALNKKNNLLLGNGNGGFINKTSDNTFGPIVTNLEDARNVGWGDYNNDGFIDVFVKRANGIQQEYSSFFQNSGGTTSIQKTQAQIGDIVSTSGSLYNSMGATLGWCDFNNDGFLDIYSPKGIYKDNTLWKNSNGVFNDDTPTLLRPVQTSTHGFSWGDYDNDGDFDLFTGTKPEANVKHSFLFANNSTPASTSFTDMTSTDGGPLNTNQYWVQGSSFIDIDNDGDLDLFTGTRESAILTPPSILYQNSGASGGYVFSQYQQVVLDPGNGNSTSESRGVAFADINNNGYLDMVVARDGEPLLFINQKSGFNYTLINCIGTGTTNSSAIGSRVRLITNIPEQNGITSQLREISGQTGFGGQNDLRAHFGLGTAAKIDEIKAQWLNSTGGSTRQENTYTDMPVNKFIVFTQGDLNVTTNVIKSQNFLYLFGNTGGSVEFTTADIDGGSLTMLRTNSNPSGTFNGNSAASPDGTTITPDAVYPDRYWTITQNNLTGFVSKVYLDASNLNGLPNLDKVVLLKRSNSGNAWTPLNTERIGNTLYSSGISSFSEFAIGYKESGILVGVNVFLHGDYDSNTGDMRVDIHSSIPFTSPYSEDVRSVSTIPQNIVDWVLVQLKTTANGSAVASKSAFLRNDGKIVADDGITEYIEMDAAAGSYYIVVKHRNHLSVMSTNAVSLNNIQSNVLEIGK